MKKQRIFFIALATLILLLLVSGSVAAIYIFASPITAQVNIQPMKKNVQNASTLDVVTNQSDVTQNQIVGAHLLSATTQQTSAATSSGVAYTSGTTASGTIAMSDAIVYEQNAFGDLTIYAGSTITGTDGITVITDKTASLCICDPGSVSIPAHVSSPGAYGNMPVGAFHINASGLTIQKVRWSATFVNSTAFTGGGNGTPYTVVQQSDITAGEQALAPTVRQSALSALNAKVSSSEQWVQTPTCTTTPTTDGTVGKAVQNFHVTVAATCSGEVYDTQAVKTAAAQNLTALAQSELGNAYQLLGAISTTINKVQVANQQQGTLTISLTSEGTWVAHFTNAQKLHLAQLIEGKSIADAQKLLSQQGGIGHATIALMHSFWLWNKLPTDPNKINITVLR